ncbi:hypothetical protein [Vulcanisaeta sp. JCM 16159]|uniref:hypothetical protein n=1 Tax=Vulcanisaeta sp. JCM 16159 TaxID=1295371 RepID=UPI0006D29770|nr:hypothetical protein [Vulcanisaeta sp. JCM 16159]
MSVNTGSIQDYVRYVYIMSLVSALAMAVAVDYVLTELWIYGTADLTILVITPVFMFMLSMLVISSITMIKQLRGNFSKMTSRAKALMITYITFFIIALIYFTYVSIIHYAGLGLTISDPQLIGDHYLGFGLALYDAGLLTTSWQLIEDLLNGKLSSLYKFFIMMFKSQSSDDDDDTIIIK